MKAIKASQGEGVLLSWLQNIIDATLPVKNKKPTLQSIVNSKLFYVF
jgi:hypothetical protein